MLAGLGCILVVGEGVGWYGVAVEQDTEDQEKEKNEGGGGTFGTALVGIINLMCHVTLLDQDSVALGGNGMMDNLDKCMISRSLRFSCTLYF